MKREDSPEVFEWQVLPFATACSPCCATFSLQMHARDHRGPKEGVRHSVEHCFYVNTPDEAKELVDRLRQMLTSGGFEIASGLATYLTYSGTYLQKKDLIAWNDGFHRKNQPDRTGLRPQLALADGCLVLQEPNFGVW